MTDAARRARTAVALLALPAVLAAQDTVAVSPPPPLRALAVDTTRVRAFERSYDMLVHAADSAVAIGRREVTFASAMHMGTPAWLLRETRSGAIPAADSLYLSLDMRPLHWSSTLGRARLVIAFSRDSAFGGTSGPGGKQTIVLAGHPDLIVSLAMLEAVLPLLTLTPAFAESVAVIAVDQASGAVLPAELMVIGEETFPAPLSPLADTAVPADSVQPSDFTLFRDRSALARTAWIVALRADQRSMVLWVDVETGAMLRLQHPLPAHGASLLEYRAVPIALDLIAADTPPRPPPDP